MKSSSYPNPKLNSRLKKFEKKWMCCFASGEKHQSGQWGKGKNWMPKHLGSPNGAKRRKQKQKATASRMQDIGLGGEGGALCKTGRRFKF